MKKKNFLIRMALKLYDYNISVCYKASLRQAELTNKHIIKSQRYLAQAIKLIKEKEKWIKRLKCK